MERVPWPTDHAGLTADDIPIGYSAYATCWDDLHGYAPQVAGDDTDDSGRTVILLSLSPGHYESVTLVSAGTPPGPAGKALLEALGALRTGGSGGQVGSLPGQTGAPAQGQQSREDTQ